MYLDEIYNLLTSNSKQLLFSLILFSVLTSITIEDIKYMLISEWKIKVLFFIGLIYSISNMYSTNKNNQVTDTNILIAYSGIYFIIIYLSKKLAERIVKKKILGLGDIKIFSTSILWTGIDGGYITFKVAFILSAIYSLAGNLLGKLKSFQTFPFAPFISIGIIYSWINGHN